MHDILGALAYARKMAYFSLPPQCEPPLAQAPATELSFKKTTEGTETLVPTDKDSHISISFPLLHDLIHPLTIEGVSSTVPGKVDIKVKEICLAEEHDVMVEPDKWTDS